jgi:hypothetical protein
MDAVVVYESLWGNTAQVARAVAEGLGPGARALRTDEAGPDAVVSAELVVAGAPVLGFKLSSPKMRDAIRQNPGKGPAPDLSCPPLCDWLESLTPAASVRGAAFDTRVRGPFGKGAPEIARRLEAAGYRQLAEPEGFIVKGKHGPMRDGELERAREWGRQLARALQERRDP